VPYASALKQAFGDTQIESLWLPFFVSACNLSQAKTVVLDSGPLWQAVMASNSPAGLLPPVVLNGDLLVDGAILENVPVSSMRTRMGTPLEHRRGNGTVIAIDVDARENLTAPEGADEIRTRELLKSRFNRSGRRLPSIIDILKQAGHIGGLAQREKTIGMADYYLEPPVTKFPMMGYKHAADIIEVGYRYASEQIASWDLAI
jgi:NTE family protein/lysophospholipid hydrolase